MTDVRSFDREWKWMARGMGEKFGYPRQVKARDTSESHFDALACIYISQIAFQKSAILWD